MSTSSTPADRIERSIAIAATPERVWQIVSEPGWWINDGTIRPHRLDDHGDGVVTVHDEQHSAWRIRVEQTDPPRHAAFRWIGRDGEQDGEGAGTLTEFWIDRTDSGVTLRVVESGLENIPAEKRAAYLQDNTSGWEAELGAARAAAEA